VTQTRICNTGKAVQSTNIFKKIEKISDAKIKDAQEAPSPKYSKILFTKPLFPKQSVLRAGTTSYDKFI